jgi:DNA-directed RNA polymerase subunit RPC12/RpoP
MIVVVCKCGKRLRAKDEYAGKRAKCPACSQKLIVPKPKTHHKTPSSNYKEALVEPPRVTRATDPKTEIYMKRYYCNTQAEMSEALRVRKKQFPQVNSCYRPSGRRSPETVASLTKGLLLGSSIAACVGLIEMFIIAFIVRLFFRGEVDLDGLRIGSGITCWLITFVALGAITGLVMVSFSRRGMNRDPLLAALMAVAATITAVLLLIAGTRLIFGSWSAPTKEPVGTAIAGAIQAVMGPFDRYWRGLLPLISFVSMVSLAALIAACIAASAVRKRKFCEKCEEFLSEPIESYLIPLSADGARRLVEVLSKRPRDPVDLFNTFDLYRGRDCDTQLLVCPSCGAGILEATINFMTGRVRILKVGRVDEEIENNSWLIASVWLSSKEVEILSPFRVNVSLLYPLSMHVEYKLGGMVNIKLPD